jgi:hypothetical protein
MTKLAMQAFMSHMHEFCYAFSISFGAFRLSLIFLYSIFIKLFIVWCFAIRRMDFELWIVKELNEWFEIGWW